MVASIQFFVNNIAMYDVPLAGTPQQFQQYSESLPDIETSDYYTDFNSQSYFVVCVNLRASPKEFVRCGTSTSTFNSDLCLQLKGTRIRPSVVMTMTMLAVAMAMGIIITIPSCEDASHHHLYIRTSIIITTASDGSMLL